ncbi:MAG: SulP family inorganic anion transporter [Anaerolineae bacterium]|nr:SulP family inorganic anion transporter [Anaerolineae bacterium]
MSIANQFSLFRARHYLRYTFQHDLIAGITGATAGIPQAMAFALLAGVEPAYGLYAAVIAPIVGALAGSATYMTTGPTNTLMLLVGSALEPLQGTFQVGVLIVTLSVLAGIFQLVLGLLRLGDLTRFVSRAVVTGFLTGAAVLMATEQLSTFSGIPRGKHGGLVHTLNLLAERIDEVHVPTLAMGLLTMTAILLFRRTRIRSLGIFVAVAGTSVVIAILGGWAEGVILVRNIAPLPSSLPAASLPQADAARHLAASALAVALLGLVQTVALSQSLKEPDGRLPNASREFIGQGLSNIAAGVFQGLPSGGSLSRTAVNVSAGARTRLANVWAGLLVAMIMLLFSDLAGHIALASLSAHLILAAWSLVDPAEISFLWKASWTGRWAMAATFVATLLLPLQYSVFVGVALSLLLYIRQSSHLHITQLEPVGPYQFREIPFSPALPDRTLVILSVQGNLFFAAMRDLEQRLPVPSQTRQPVLILRLRGDDMLAGTGTWTLVNYAERLRARGGKLILCGVEDKVLKTLQRTGALDKIGPQNVFAARDVLLMSLQEAVEYAQKWLAAQPSLPPEEAPDIRPPRKPRRAGRKGSPAQKDATGQPVP